MDLMSFKRSLSLIQSQLNFSKKEIFEKNIDKYWSEAPLDTQSHHMGTTRMGNNLKYSVTDPNLKVHGINNLYSRKFNLPNKWSIKPDPDFNSIIN